jgi:HEAT repeat protein
MLLAFSTTLLVAAVAAADGPRSRSRPSVDELKAVLLDARTDRARIAAATLLGTLDDARAEAVLIEALGNPEEATRFGAARALGRPGRTASVEALSTLLRSPRELPRIRGTAARSLAAIGDPRAVPVLLAMRQDGSAEVRVAVRQALLTLPSGVVPLSSVDVLLEILTDREASESARAEAARRLSETPDPRGVALLIAALDAPAPVRRQPAPLSEFVRARAEASSSLPAAAARALGQLGAKEAVPFLVRAARNPDEEVRVAAYEALARLRTPAAIAVAIHGLGDREARARRWAAFILAELGTSDALERLRSAVEDSDEGVRLHATRALVRLHDVGSVDVLVKALERERIPLVRDALQNALSMLTH